MISSTGSRVIVVGEVRLYVPVRDDGALIDSVSTAVTARTSVLALKVMPEFVLPPMVPVASS